MLMPNDYVLIETQRMHRRELLEHARQMRLLRQQRPVTPNWLDRGLALFGRVLVGCGRRLEMRAPIGWNGTQP